MGLSHLDPEILRMPLLEAIAVGCLSGLVGTLMVMGKRVFFAESLSHGIFPGAVLGVVVANLLSLDLSTGLMVGAALFCLPLAWLMRWLSTVEGISSTAAAGVTLTGCPSRWAARRAKWVSSAGTSSGRSRSGGRCRRTTFRR